MSDTLYTPPVSPPAPPSTPPKRKRTISLTWGIIGMVASLFVGVGIGAAGAPSETDDASTRVAEGPRSPAVELPPAEGVEPESPAAPVEETDETVGASVDNPVPVGSAARVGDWTVKVTGYTPNASDAVMRENMFNTKPRDDEQYVLVTLRTTYEGSGSSDPWSDQTWSVITSGGDLYEEAGQVWPNDLNDKGNVPSGASAVGNVGFLVKSADVRGLVLYIEAYTADFETEGAFLALS